MNISRFAIIITLATATAVAGCASTPQEGPAALIQEAEDASKRIDTAQEAFDHGYRPDRFCIPGMGVHWSHPADVDTELSADHPEVVLFQPTTTDVSDRENQRFLGIEYLAVTEGTPHNDTENPPSLMGVDLHGPVAGHAPGMPWHADLHIYLADGLESDASFPATHAEISCPDGTTPPGGG